MAIRFVDVGPGESGPRVAARLTAPSPAVERQHGDAPDGAPAVKLLLAKPEPKQRGRKKPLR